MRQDGDDKQASRLRVIYDSLLIDKCTIHPVFGLITRRSHVCLSSTQQQQQQHAALKKHLLNLLQTDPYPLA